MKTTDEVNWNDYELYDKQPTWWKVCLYFYQFRRATDPINNIAVDYKKAAGKIYVYSIFTVPPMHWNCRHKIFFDED